MAMLDLNILIAVLLVLFGFVIVASTFKPRFLSSRSFSLFRVLFPSWRFFEDLGPVAKLSFRVRDVEGDFGPWLPGLPSESQSWHQLIFNPHGNLQMACHALIEQALADINDRSPESDQDFSDSVSYRLLCHLVRDQISKRFPLVSTSFYQFQIMVRLPEGETYQALLSQEHEV